MPKPKWDTRRKGRPWTKEESWKRFELFPEKFELFPEKNEMFNGQLLWSQRERENILGLLLELVGADKAVRLGSPEVWRAVIADLPE
jgi:hypothetical protein